MDISVISKKMNDWYSQPLGQSLLQFEKNNYEEVIKKIFGYYLLQINICQCQVFSNNSLIPNQIIISEDLCVCDKCGGSVIVADFKELPFLCDSIDVVAISHVLEFTKNPYLVLEEVYHALIPQGKVIIFSFNPHSVWGICHMFRDHIKVPWLGRFISAGKIRNWLEKLGFSIIDYRTFYFRPPINNANVLSKLHLVESMFKKFLPNFGAVSMFVAEKRVMTGTPLKEYSHLLKRKMPAEVVLPN